MDDTPLRIAMFTNNYYPFIGGVPLSIDRLTKGLRAMGHTVTIFCPKYPEQPEPDHDPGIVRCKLLRYQKSEVYNFPIINIFSRRIHNEFLRRGFDLVHSHHPFWMGKKGYRLAKKYKLPVVFTFHTRFDQYSHYLPVFKKFFKAYIANRFIKRFSGRCDAVFTPTQTAKDFLTDLGVKTPMDILPTGIEIGRGERDQALRESLAPGGGVLLCTVSRLAKEKNIFFLLEGIRYIKEHTALPFRCVVVGDGPERGEIEAFIRSSCLEDTVTLVGSVPPEEVARYYRASDLFVYSSRSETQGMVLLEAMAGQCPVVAVSSGGVDDVIENGVNGYRTQEVTEEWAQRVIELMSDGEKRRVMSGNAYEHAKQYSAEEMAAHAAHVYRGAVAKRHGA